MYKVFRDNKGADDAKILQLMFFLHKPVAKALW